MRTSDFTSIAVANTELVNQHMTNTLPKCHCLMGFIKNVVSETFPLKFPALVVILDIPE